MGIKMKTGRMFEREKKNKKKINIHTVAFRLRINTTLSTVVVLLTRL